MIEVRTERVLLDGKRCRTITGLRAKCMDDLPRDYTAGYPMLYNKADGGMVIRLSPIVSAIWAVGDEIEEGEFQECILAIRKAGLRLYMINHPDELSDVWRGCESFHI